MQLPTQGHPLHTRSLTMVVTQQPGGSWRARGDVIDLRKCSFVPMMSDIQPAGIIHQMSIEVGIDPVSRRIDSIDTDQPFVAIEPSKHSGGECCRDPAPRLQEMVGDVIDSGFPKRLSAVFGGPRGCSHLLTLFQLMASGLPKALELEAKLIGGSGATRRPGEDIFRRAAFVDGIEIDDTSVGLAIQLADFLTKPLDAVSHPLDRLALQHDARAYAVIARQTLSISRLQAAQRERTGQSLSTAEWQDLDEEVSELEGAGVMAGLAGVLFRRFGDVEERRLLLDCLLQLAPGYIQTMATLMERWFSSDERSLHVLDSDAEPSVASVGGTPDSCYMWRVGGPMASFRGPGFRGDD